VTSKQLLSRLLAGTAFLALAAGDARATFYAYAVQQTTGYTFAGGTVGTLTPLSSTSSAQVGSISGSEAHVGGLDALQSYVGSARPGENTFTALGQVNPDYARGDALVTAPPGNFGTNNVAEAYLIGPGNSAGSGSWAVSAPVTVATPSALTLAFNYTNQLIVNNTGVPVPGTVAADFSYTFTLQDANGVVIFTSSPTAINGNASLTVPGSINRPGSGSIAILTGLLSVGTYTATISGSEHTFINSVPEPSSVLLSAVGIGVLGLVMRKRLSRDAE